MPVSLSLGSLFLVVSRCSCRLIIDNFQYRIVDQFLKRRVIEVGVGYLPFLGGAQMKHLAPGKRHTDWCVSLVANGLQVGSS